MTKPLMVFWIPNFDPHLKPKPLEVWAPGPVTGQDNEVIVLHSWHLYNVGPEGTNRIAGRCWKIPNTQFERNTRYLMG